MRIVNLSPEAIHYLASASTAALNDRRLRLSFGADEKGNYVCYKLGEGMWSAPMYDQPDPYRDLGAAQHESHDLSRFDC